MNIEKHYKQQILNSYRISKHDGNLGLRSSIDMQIIDNIPNIVFFNGYYGMSVYQKYNPHLNITKYEFIYRKENPKWLMNKINSVMNNFLPGTVFNGFIEYSNDDYDINIYNFQIIFIYKHINQRFMILPPHILISIIRDLMIEVRGFIQNIKKASVEELTKIIYEQNNISDPEWHTKTTKLNIDDRFLEKL